MDMSNSESMHSNASEKVVVTSEDDVCTDQDMKQKPDQEQTSVQPDYVDIQHVNHEDDGGQLEGSV